MGLGRFERHDGVVELEHDRAVSPELRDGDEVSLAEREPPILEREGEVEREQDIFAEKERALVDGDGDQSMSGARAEQHGTAGLLRHEWVAESAEGLGERRARLTLEDRGLERARVRAKRTEPRREALGAC